MKLPVSSEWIEAAIRKYIVEHRDTHPAIMRAVERTNALPLYSDWSGCVAIRADGELIEVLWDTPELAKVESDSRWRFLALIAGAKSYAQLAHLMPTRTERDRDCPVCEGTGKLSGLEELGIDAKAAVTCYCGGAGWLPANVPDP